MIPSITPPTDNLYKFVSMFGLAIFLFSLYNLNQVYDAAAANKMGIEDLKKDIQKTLIRNEESHQHEHLDAGGERASFRPSLLKKMDAELQNISEVIEKSELEETDKVDLEAEVGKLYVTLDYLNYKIKGCYILGVFGILLMILGFVQWNRREQKYRDGLLKIEYHLKNKNQGN
jgi:hypothetical protein